MDLATTIGFFGGIAAVVGTMRFGVGAMAGPLLAWTYTGTPKPVAALMLGCLVLAALLQGSLFLQHKRKGRQQAPILFALGDQDLRR